MNNKTTYIKLRVNTRPHWESRWTTQDRKVPAALRVTAQIVDDFGG